MHILTVYLLGNSFIFWEFNTPEINQNTLIAKDDICEKRQTFQNRQKRKRNFKNKQISTVKAFHVSYRFGKMSSNESV